MDTNNVTKDILRKLVSLWSSLIDKTDGSTGSLWALRITPQDASVTSSTALAASLVVRASAGRLLIAAVYNGNVGTQYIQVHNAASLPANTVVPLFTFALTTGAVQVLNFDLTGLPCSTGIVLCNSSTAATKTIGAADCWFTVTHKK